MSRKHEPATDPEVIVVECDIPEPPAKVWKALTQPELLAKWLLPDASASDATVAPNTRERRSPMHRAADATVEYHVLAAEPHRRLRLSWSVEEDDAYGRQQRLDSTVTFELTATPAGGTHLRLVHGNFRVTSRETVMMLRQAA